MSRPLSSHDGHARLDKAMSAIKCSPSALPLVGRSPGEPAPFTLFKGGRDEDARTPTVPYLTPSVLPVVVQSLTTTNKNTHVHKIDNNVKVLFMQPYQKNT